MATTQPQIFDDAPLSADIPADSDAAKVQDSTQTWGREISTALRALSVSLSAVQSTPATTPTTKATAAATAATPLQGVAGNNGWSPQLALVAYGMGLIVQVTGWSGGTGTPPASGLYVSATGLTPNAALAVNIKGTAGLQGASGGWTFLLNFGTGTTAPPGAGTVVFNNATFGSITHVFVSTVDRNGVNVATAMGTIAAGNFLRIFEENALQNLATFQVTVVTPNSGYLDLTVTPLSGGILDNFAGVGFSFANAAIAANPSAKVGPAAANGTALTYMSSDSAPAIDLTAIFPWTGQHSFSKPPQLPAYNVAGLPTPGAGKYCFAIALDATLTMITGLGLAPVGGGGNVVPVFWNGAGWLIV